MLRVEHLEQFYGESHILRDLNLDAGRNACTCIMGRNGVGKTTLLKCLMGLLPPRSGSVFFDGEDITRLSPGDRARLGFGYVPQGRQIFPLLTVRENLELGLAARRDASGRIPDFIFDFFPALADMANRLGGDLSGGQQQQLAIGRALAIGPRLMLLDEPAEGIQPNIVNEIAKTIRRMCGEMDITVVLVEQKIPFARAIADRYVIMERGHAVRDGSMAGLDGATIRSFLTV
ncbi:MAG: urea ABC transporter ATP-binding subunit UrtE [Planctomycetota bacterium]|jgi:urea transport system ATP-binding protein|nr:urea ABC transporter ATP-binding subunit UrtE [Planctomycetota bacterium]